MRNLTREDIVYQNKLFKISEKRWKMITPWLIGVGILLVLAIIYIIFKISTS